MGTIRINDLWRGVTRAREALAVTWSGAGSPFIPDVL